METITSGLTLDCSDPLNPTYSIEGTHDGFPAHEIYLDRQEINTYDPVQAGRGLGALSGVDPEKAVDYLLDINEELGDVLTAAGLREDMFMLFRKDPGLAAQFLNELIGNKKRGPGKLKNIPISDFEKQMLATIKDYFKENPLFKFKQVAKTVRKGILKPRPGEKRESRKIIKKLPKEDKKQKKWKIP